MKTFLVERKQRKFIVNRLVLQEMQMAGKRQRTLGENTDFYKESKRTINGKYEKTIIFH